MMGLRNWKERETSRSLPSPLFYFFNTFHDVSMAMASSVKSQAEKLRAQHEDYQKKEPRAPRVGRYHDYTPHNVSVAELCKEVGQVERFLKQKALE